MNSTPDNWREARRLRAWRLKQQGWSQRQIAEALGVSEGAVSQWMTRARDGGAEALRHRPPPGAPARLTAEPRAHLPTLLQQGPEAYGFRGELWTRGRIAAVIRLTCDISYHLTPIGRVCQALRWSLQKPARRARQRDEAAIARWRDEIWPTIKKGQSNSNNASSSSMSQALIPCQASCAPMPPWGTRRSCGTGGPAITSPPSVPSRLRASCMSTARTTPCIRRMW
jgi:transposase